MAVAKVNDEEFVKTFEPHGASKTAKIIGVVERAVYNRRRRLEQALGRSINAPATTTRITSAEFPSRMIFEIGNGIIPIGSDAHIWPGNLTTAQRGFLYFLRRYKKEIPMVVMNGDLFDGAGISRFPSIGWEDKPTVVEELSACKIFTNSIQDIVPHAELVFTLGNHDMRLETYLANNTPDVNGVLGTRLKDHFSDWLMGWTCWLNDEVIIKHRFKGGIHATHNNALWSGRTIVTGHLHSQKVTGFSDYNGHRWGVDCGTLADPYGSQFTNYTEDNPVNWRSGFAVLVFKDGKLLPPELVQVWDENKITFRGEVIEV